MAFIDHLANPVSVDNLLALMRYYHDLITMTYTILINGYLSTISVKSYSDQADGFGKEAF